jgi:hypothetical protein
MTHILKFLNLAFAGVVILLLAIVSPAMQVFAQDAPAKVGQPLAAQPAKPKYTTQELNKLQTLQLVASSNNARTERLITSIRSFLTVEQQRQCRQIVATHHEEFDQLRDQRNQIMENASDKNGTPQKLLDWRARTLDLARGIRQELRAKVLTEQQKKDLQLEMKRQRELKAEKAREVSAKAGSAQAESAPAGLPAEKKVAQP